MLALLQYKIADRIGVNSPFQNYYWKNIVFYR